MTHTFSFFRVGGFNQVRLATGADLLNLDQLDQKLWVALACPTKGLEFDGRTLELIDSDGDGRIRATELIAAVKWAASLLKDADELVRAPAALRIEALKDSDEGKRLAQAIRTVLQGLGKPDATEISVEQTAQALQAFNAMGNNGDGVLSADSATSVETRALIEDVMATVGSVNDASGKAGVDQAKVAEFSKAVAAYVAWHAQASQDPALLPLKSDSAAALQALTAVRNKIDDFFVRCQLAAFDARAVAALNREEKEYYALAAQDLVITADEILRLPLAQIAPAAALPLQKGLNPAWIAAMAQFTSKVVTPMLGERAQLTQAEWESIKGALGKFENWQAGKSGGAVEKLGIERLQALNAQNPEQLLAPLFALEKEQEGTAAAIASIERLARYVRDLHKLALNFVSFQQFYQRKTPAIFQIGTLYLDQRQSELCLRVEDAGKHATMAPLSRSYLVYCDCVRKTTGEKMTIAAALTNGDAENLMVGRNGIFYGRDGRDWDATVIKLVDNPISLRQAFWSPYKKLVRFIEEQVAKRAEESKASSDSLLTDAASTVGSTIKTGNADAVKGKKIDVGVVAALGVAVGGITAALGALLEAFFGLGLWMPLGVVGLMLLISGPSMLIAWLKLRQRNIGPLLDANGWAVNANAKINVPFGASLTRIAALPKGSNLDLIDPFAEKKTPWGTIIVVLALVGVLAWLWHSGKLFG